MTHKTEVKKEEKKKIDNQEIIKDEKMDTKCADVATAEKKETESEKKPAEAAKGESDPPEKKEEPAMTQAEIEEMLRAAEEKGYLRGRNERIEALMQVPGVYERVGAPHGEGDAEGSKSEFLSHRRVSIWDY